MKNQTLSAERARELFDYDPLTGGLTWRVNKYRAKAGQPAGCRRDDGYIKITADQGRYWAHRVVWLMTYGEWPPGMVDHKNGDTSDNRVGNLRDGSHGVNQQNMRGLQTESASGVLGVCTRVYQTCTRFEARIWAEGRQLSLGYFDTPKEAHQAYIVAKRSLHAGCTI